MNRKPEISTQEMNSMLSRRSLLQTASCGFGYMALMGMCGEAAARDDTYKNPLAARPSLRSCARVRTFEANGNTTSDTATSKFST